MRKNRQAWLATLLSRHDGVGDLVVGHRPLDRVDQMRLHVVAVFRHQLPHPLEVGLGEHDGEEVSEIVVLPGRCLLEFAAQLVGEHLGGLGADLADLGIDLCIPPVGRPGDAQPLDVTLDRLHPLDVVGDGSAVAVVRSRRDHAHHQRAVGDCAGDRSDVLDRLPPDTPGAVSSLVPG